MRHRAVVDGDGLPARSTSVLDRGGEEDDLEERGGREGMDAAPTTVVEAEARLGELVLEETEMAGCCCCCCAVWDWNAWGEWVAVGEPTRMPA